MLASAPPWALSVLALSVAHSCVVEPNRTQRSRSHDPGLKDAAVASQRLDAVIAQAKTDRGRLDSNALGPLSLTALGIASVVGAGIFATTGTAAAQYAGPAVVFTFLLAGIAAGAMALCYAELAAMIPAPAQPTPTPTRSSGSFPAWFIGWDLLLEYLFAASTVAVGWAGYAVSLLDSIGIDAAELDHRTPIRRRLRGAQPAGDRDRGAGDRAAHRRHAPVGDGEQLHGRAQARGADPVRRRRRNLRLERQLGAVHPRSRASSATAGGSSASSAPAASSSSPTSASTPSRPRRRRAATRSGRSRSA